MIIYIVLLLLSHNIFRKNIFKMTDHLSSQCFSFYLCGRLRDLKTLKIVSSLVSLTSTILNLYCSKNNLSMIVSYSHYSRAFAMLSSWNVSMFLLYSIEYPLNLSSSVIYSTWMAFLNLLDAIIDCLHNSTFHSI